MGMTWIIKSTILAFIISTAFIGISFNRIFLSWRVIELNLILFIPIIIFSKNFYFSSIMGLKYFFIQSLASILLLSIVMLNLTLYEEALIDIFILLSLGWKLGVPPFHRWIINLIIDLDYQNFFIVSSWQKVIPFHIISRLSTKYIELIIILSLIFSVTMRIMSQLNIKKILIISSIFTTSWVIAAILFSTSFWILVLGIYATILWLIAKILYLPKSSNKVYVLALSSSFIEKITLFLLVLSMAGFPPLIGFFLKLTIIMGLIFLGINFISSLIILSSVIMIYIYTTIFFLSLTIYSLELNYLSSFYYFKSSTVYFRLGLSFIPLIIFYF